MFVYHIFFLVDPSSYSFEIVRYYILRLSPHHEPSFPVPMTSIDEEGDPEEELSKDINDPRPKNAQTTMMMKAGNCPIFGSSLQVGEGPDELSST